ncbi:MAG: response regulator transcription factor [Firmicutes bacterium]|nr:response regulator transcription factor [Bacillota bacterium]
MEYSVMIVDDQSIARKYFESVVRAAPDFSLLYSLDSASVAHIYCSRFSIDLVIMDIVMADGSSGIDAAARIKEISPSTRILMVTSMAEGLFLSRAKEAGADGFWYKDDEETELITAMRDIMSGKRVWPEGSPVIKIGDALSSELTRAEMDVLREISTGASNQQIADRLGIETGTVKSHINHLLRKTVLNNRTELAIEARLKGLVVSSGRQ